MQKPIIINQKAYQDFRDIITNHYKANPDSIWYGGYVDYEWEHLRHILENTIPFSLKDKKVLEFGCNIGASSVILSCFEAHIDAIDVNEAAVKATLCNNASYGKEKFIHAQHIPDTTHLPFPNNHFDFILANSVLEYVCDHHIDKVLNELKRVLKYDGVIAITGTSNRLALREIHSRRICTNYIPNFIIKILNLKIQKGLSPWKLMTHFRHYELLELSDRSHNYLKVREKFGWSDKKIKIFKFVAHILSYINLTPSLLTPSLTATFRKKS